MRDYWKVARWEIRKSIKDKTFLVISLLIPLFIIGAGVIPTLLAEKEGASKIEIAILDESGQLASALEERLRDSSFNLVQIGGKQAELKARVKEGDLDLFLYIPKDFYSTNQAFVYFRNLNILENDIEDILSDLAIDYRLTQVGLQPRQIKRLVRPVKLTPVPLSREGESNVFSMFIPLILAGMMILSSLFTGSILMQSIIKEKNDRVVEIVLSSIPANDLIKGKVIGYGLLGLLQMALWASVGAAVASYYLDFSLGSFLEGKLFLMGIYFFLGYLLMAGMSSLLGATIKDSQFGNQSVGLGMMLFIVPIYFLKLIVKNPHGLVPKILSYIPLTTPNTMLLRLGITQIPFWEVVLTILILAVFDLLLIRFAAKIFRVGILMYGKNVTFREVFRWAKLNI
ncbi:hypothetical protein BBF96_03110 [Anoxybacter fermentans]|uniref:ABC-2 type transporter transmembrane domain-containing protein n=1 Tax=Anoxybacter fermentans TaxID=1323375 RepID=A0A3S9SW13_9FIRM|nr:ABC transporter permease [Anoxybacter fermentans]AZR72458.1 hypothetical protein BBF96_03110 [Anoxybacter fermentans]